MSELVDISVKVICLTIFALIAEMQGLPMLLERVNQALLSSRLPIPPDIVKIVNHNFGFKFEFLDSIVKRILLKVNFDSIPQLKYIEPKYNDIIVGPSPRCLSSLMYGNKVNIDLTSELLDVCDRCVEPLEIVSCNLISILPGTSIKPHVSEYCGVMTYLLVLEGSKLTHLKFGKQVFTLKTKSSAFFDPAVMTGIENTGPNVVRLLKLEVYRPFDHGLDAVNWSTLQVLSDSGEIQHTCKMANM